MSRGIAVSGNSLYVAGTTYGNASFGSYSLLSAGSLDVFLAKFDAATGDVVWAVSDGGKGTDRASGVATDGTYTYVAGDFSQKADFGVHLLQAEGSNDGFLACYNDDGTVLWVKPVSGGGGAFVNDVALSSDGTGIAAVGVFTGSVTFGGTTLISGGPQDAFIAQYLASGELVDLGQCRSR